MFIELSSGVENPWLIAENIYLDDKAHNIKYIESFPFSIGIIISMLRVFLGYLEVFLRNFFKCMGVFFFIYVSAMPEFVYSGECSEILEHFPQQARLAYFSPQCARHAEPD